MFAFDMMITLPSPLEPGARGRLFAFHHYVRQNFQATNLIGNLIELID